MRLTHRRTLALCAAAALALAAPAVAAAQGPATARPRRPPRQGAARGQAHRRHLRGEPQLRQPVRRLGGRQRAAPRRSRAHDAGQPERHALHVPAAGRREPGDAAAAGDVHGHDDRDGFESNFRNARSTIDDFIQPEDDQDVPGAAASSPPTACSNAHRPARRLHARPRAPLLPGAVPAQRRQAEPLRDRQRRRRPDHGLLRHAAPCRSTSTCTAAATRLRDRRRLLPGGLRRLVPQPPVAHRGGDADLASAATRRRNDLHSVVDANGMPTTNDRNYPAQHPRR